MGLEVLFLSDFYLSESLDFFLFADGCRSLGFVVLSFHLGGLHEKTRTGASFIPGWLFDFVSRTDWVISYLVIWRYVHFNMLIKYTCDSKIKITNVTHGLPIPVYWQTDSTPNQVVVLCLHDTGVRFQTGVKLSPPVQQPGWTHAGVTRAGMTFRGVIM